MELATNQLNKEIFKNAKPYESEDEWIDDCQTIEQFARGLATMKKNLKEGVYDNK